MNNKKKDKFARDFRLYNAIMGNIWKFVATVIIGVCLGYLTTRKGEDDNNYILFFTILFFIIGIINFFVGIIKEHKKLEKREQMRRKLENKEEKTNDEN